MNIQQYATILSRFNRVPAVEPTSQNVVLIHWTEMKWENSLLGRLRFFDEILHHGKDLVEVRPFVRALGAFYRTDCVVTTFLSSRRNRSQQQTVLMGNERILIPEEKNGDVHLCIFPFFVRDADAAFGLKSGGEGIYPYRDGILFADAYQVPFPGGSYHGGDNVKTDHGRVCFLTRHPDAVRDIYSDWYGKRGVMYFPFQTRVATLKLVSDFFAPPSPVSDVCFPNAHLRSSGTLRKRLSQYDPHLLVQDVLNTYASANSARANPLDDVALFIEYPFLSGYENNNCGGGCVVVGDADATSCPLASAAYVDAFSSSSSSSSSERQRASPRYVPFLVNGLNPKTVIQVKHPYDRYVEYQKIDDTRVSRSDWIVFLYERFHGELLPSDVRLVSVENTVLGYKYRGAFLCLSYPMLADSPLNGREVEEDEEEEEEEGDRDFGEGENGAEHACESPRRVRNGTNTNTDVLLSPVENFNPKKDPRLVVFGTYGYDDDYDIYQVKHVQLRNELWCLVDRKRVENLDNCNLGHDKKIKTKQCREEKEEEKASSFSSGVSSEESPKFFRKAAAPLTKFVYEWIEFFYENRDKRNVSYGRMDAFRLAVVVARHKICLSLNLAPSRSLRLHANRTRSLKLRGREYVFHLDKAAIDFINDMRLSTTTNASEDTEKKEENCIIL